MDRKFEVVISGVSGLFPECNSIADYEEKVFLEDFQFITDDDSKWTKDQFNIPHQTGKVRDVFKFDQSFFAIHRKLCAVMDIHTKKCIEGAFEALCDAGVHPSELSGSKTAVIMSSMTSETEYESVQVGKSAHAMLGHNRGMQANRLSYFFDFKGPSCVFDSTWVGGMQALTHACKLIENGSVPAAIVGCSNFFFHPEVSIHYTGLNRLNRDGKTKSFSADADGYTRSEACVVFFLQRSVDAKRSYGTIIKTICSAEMNSFDTFPDYFNFDNFIRDFYSDINITFDDIGYIEAEGSGNLNLDAMELNAYSQLICQKRKEPLLVGSCKSKIGHTEGASSLVSLVNAIIAMRTGYIPPSANFSSPNPFIPALKDGTIQVVTEKTPLMKDYVAVTSFGLTSIYGHVLIKRNSQSLEFPLVKGVFPKDGIPRLLIVSGREEDKMKASLEKIASRPLDPYLIRLNHHVFKTTFAKHLFRGYLLQGEDKYESDVVSYQSGRKRQLWFVFSGMGSQWAEMGKWLLKIPLLANSLERCHAALVPKGIDLLALITDPDPAVYDNILHSFVGIAAVQIALVDLLFAMGIVPDGIVGHSVGELGCSYADGCLTAEQVILAAYARGKASNDATLIKGMMAAVGKGYKQIKDSLPEGIEVACHNSPSSCTLSGPTELMGGYVESLKNKGIFARLVNVSNIAYHSKHIAPAAPYLLKYLKEIIPDPKPRTSKWISSSIQESNWDTDLARFCSPEYHTNNLLSYVLFEEASRHIPKGAVTLEVAPHGLLQAILKRSLTSCTNIALTNRSNKDGVTCLLKSLADLFMNGIEMDLSPIYPQIEFPLPRETSYLHPLISWEHSELWTPACLQNISTTAFIHSWHEYEFTMQDEELLYFQLNNQIQSIGIFPHSHILNLIINLVNKSKGNKNLLPYKFENLKFFQQIEITQEKFSLHVLYQAGTCNLEVLVANEPIITGKYYVCEFPTKLSNDIPDLSSDQHFTIDSKQIYSYFKERGFSFSQKFQNLKEITIYDKGFKAIIMWDGSIQYYLEAIIKLMIFYFMIESENILDIDYIDDIIIDPSVLPKESEEFEVYYHVDVQQIISKGLNIRGIKYKPSKFKEPEYLKSLKTEFIPYSTLNNKQIFFNLSAQLIVENLKNMENNTRIVVLGRKKQDCLISSSIFEAFSAVSSVSVKSKNINIEDIKNKSEMSSLRGFNECYLVLAENSLKETSALLSVENECFVLYISKILSSSEKYPNYLSPVIEQNFEDYKVVLFKKINNIIRNANFVTVSESNSFDKIVLKNGHKQSNITFVIKYYQTLSEISTFLHVAKKRTEAKDFRYIFLDQDITKFNPALPFYQNQLFKDLTVNVCLSGVWGSLRYIDISPPNYLYSELISSKVPLNYLRCKDVELKSIGLNLIELMLPSNPDLKINILEYSGIKNGVPVFGIGKLTDDNILEVDPVLCWNKPSQWSYEESATVPLFYSLAYYMIDISTIKFFDLERVLIHCGHTPFSQVLIQTAIFYDCHILTTCFNQNQKEFILQKFPQLNEEDIIMMDINKRGSFHIHVGNVTRGEGVGLVVNCFDRNDLLEASLACLSFRGKYFHVKHQNPGNQSTLGMKIFIKETATYGCNGNLLMDIESNVKKTLINLVTKGIEYKVVKPLDYKVIEDPSSKQEVTNYILSINQQDIPKKVLLRVEPKKKTAVSNMTESEDKKKYLIIGGYNSLWFDIMIWLVGKGIEELYMVVDEKEIPEYIQRRLKNFVKKHGTVSINFFPSKYLDAVDQCDKLMQKIQLSNGPSHGTNISTIFITPGIEKYLSNVDTALRKHFKNSLLVSIGSDEEDVFQNRKINGFQSISLILKRNIFRNRSLLNIMEKVLYSGQNFDSLTIDQNKELEEESEIVESYLPASIPELVELGLSTRPETGFIEVLTNAGPYQKVKGCNPVFIIPGFKIIKLHNIVTKLLYPAFQAVLPENINSLDCLAEQLAEEMNKFNIKMFTLLGESWSGALCLQVAKYLELLGNSVEILLIDAAPKTVKEWRKRATRNNNVITKYLPPSEKGEFSLEELKTMTEKISELMGRIEYSQWDKEDIRKGLDVVMNRLEVLDSFSEDNLNLNAQIHLFRPLKSYLKDHCDLQQMCERTVGVHIMDGLSLNSMFESHRLIQDINNLVLLEYKSAAIPQDVGEVGTLDLILDAKFRNEGLIRQ